ncbi:MAG TPA: hypothetical protein VMH81_02215 [Bryobacteraceae bacterium]|nr:hypothetical protein [Bryobacteraceae bacterium]
MGIEVRRGREFQAGDRKGAGDVAVVNETFARLFFPNEDAIGKLVRPQRGGDVEPWSEIVGVVADNKYAFYSEAPMPQLSLHSCRGAGGYSSRFGRRPGRQPRSAPFAG